MRLETIAIFAGLTLITLVVVSLNSRPIPQSLINFTSEAPPASWQIYKSKYGYEVTYPVDFSYLTCLDDTQVFFYSISLHPGSCDEPRDFDAFSIVGPINSNLDKEYITTKVEKFRVNSLAFALNGSRAIQYVNYPIGPMSDRFIDLVVVDQDDIQFHLYFRGNESDSLNMMSSFRLVK